MTDDGTPSPREPLKADEMTVLQRIEAAGQVYTPRERLVADHCLRTYPKLAFETVVTLAEQTGTSAPTVMRFAVKAGFNGFSDLQQQVRCSMEGDWSRVLDRLEGGPRPNPSRWHTRSLQADRENLERTYRNISPDTFDEIAMLLADVRRPLMLAGGEITHGLCISFAALLSWLRDDVGVFGTGALPLSTQLMRLSSDSVVFAMHLRRLTRNTSHIIEVACERGADVIVATNSPTLSVPATVRHVVVMNLEGSGGVIDSYTAAASLTNGLAAAVAELLRPGLRDRFDRLEKTWTALDIHAEGITPRDHGGRRSA